MFKNTELVVLHLHIKTQLIISKLNYIRNNLIIYDIKESFVKLSTNQKTFKVTFI